MSTKKEIICNLKKIYLSNELDGIGLVDGWNDYILPELEKALDEVHKSGQSMVMQKVTKWVSLNAQTKDTAMSDFVENHEYTVDADELIDFLQALTPTTPDK